jgi:hypothetical protein
MKLIPQGGYNDSERYSYKEIIFSNDAILEAIPQLDSAPRAILMPFAHCGRMPPCRKLCVAPANFRLQLNLAVYYFGAIDGDHTSCLLRSHVKTHDVQGRRVDV